jgi:ABC-type multidrug transport system permease subunit
LYLFAICTKQEQFSETLQDMRAGRQAGLTDILILLYIPSSELAVCTVAKNNVAGFSLSGLLLYHLLLIVTVTTGVSLGWPLVPQNL